jgi:hypothetical protein
MASRPPIAEESRLREILRQQVPRLHARLFYYKLAKPERSLLRAMVEHCSDGSTIWAAKPRLAKYADLCVRTVQRLIPKLRSRGILSELAPANTGKHKPATYRINEDALELDPRMLRYLDRQPQLPGIPRPPIPGEPIPERLVTPCHQPSRPAVTSPGDTVSPNTKAFDSRSDTSKPVRERDSTTATPLSLADQEGGIDVDVFVASLTRRR